MEATSWDFLRVEETTSKIRGDHVGFLRVEATMWNFFAWKQPGGISKIGGDQVGFSAWK
jgi:hypothetical protein